MTRPFALFTSAICVLSLAGTLAAKPNILVILADDLGYGDLGYTGCKDIPTPHIDRLARDSVIFTDGHVSGSVCAPSRAGLLTGRYQNRFGFEYNSSQLAPEVPTVADQLKAVGYTTLAVGKWHLGAAPAEIGFDHFTGLSGGGRSYFPSEGSRADHRLLRDGEDVELAGWTYLTDFLTTEGMRLVRERPSGRPFFFYMAYTTPHTPLHTREDLEKRFAHIADKGRRNYAAMVASLDEEVGEWLDFLERENLRDNTIVVFLSDNGGATVNHSDNGPWRGMKGSFWEGGQRVPFLVSWPGRIRPRWFNEPVISLDLAATFLAAAGAEARDGDGVDLVPFLTGEKPGRPHERLFWRMDPTRAVREGDLMLIKVLHDDGSTHHTLLFDLANDPVQRENLVGARPADHDRLLGLLAEWESGLAQPNSTMEQVYRDNHRRKHRMDVIGRAAERKLP